MTFNFEILCSYALHVCVFDVELQCDAAVWTTDSEWH